MLKLYNGSTSKVRFPILLIRLHQWQNQTFAYCANPVQEHCRYHLSVKPLTQHLDLTRLLRVHRLYSWFLLTVLCIHCTSIYYSRFLLLVESAIYGLRYTNILPFNVAYDWKYVVVCNQSNFEQLHLFVLYRNISLRNQLHQVFIINYVFFDKWFKQIIRFILIQPINLLCKWIYLYLD